MCFVLLPMWMSPYAESVVITMHTQAITPRMHMYVIYTQLVSILNEIKLRRLFCVNRRHTHFIISVCLSLFSLLARANIFVFILQGNCFSSADLACGREKEKESSENGNWLYCFCIKSPPWQSLRQVVRETGGSGGENGIGQKERSEGKREWRRNWAERQERRDNRGRWRQQWLLRDEENTKEHQDGEKETERERKKVRWWVARFMFSEVEYLI